MMQTRCPACTTAFRVTPEQLKMRQGQVRCGKCRQVFDALAALTDVEPVEPAVQMTADSEPMAASDDDLIPAAAPEIAATEVESEAEAEPEPTASVATAATTPPPAVAEEALDAEQPDAAVASGIVTPVVEAGPQPESESKPEAEPEPEPDVTAPAEPPRVSLLDDGEGGDALAASPWPWLLASLLAMLLLSCQLLIHFRSEALVLAPELKPALQAACDVLGCDLSLPRQPEQLSIEASDLHPDTQRKDGLVLTATLKNRALFAQQLPHLELTLTDAYDQPLLRKVIAPDEYLPPANDHAPRPVGFAPRDELAIHLSLLPENGLRGNAAGYRLYLFYP
ncbi:conserved protein of unknown function [Sterolibacterium denitrificans]|uniref:Uncharacterized protein n=2 Tax=Sterolibacterium denitrificans TaxID=157592 RepID=A0A7Z7MU09_9PROT|nr:zinc-ribbon and DUF3426 domain-containing protein [Sterolibacterium denitrificans]KYC29046.1 hypothetical protein ACY05_00150 [Sterolibacterium denitrificans]SMB21295.1 conserved protein of unknown function [Sterolibacterium denitrificans]